MSCEKCPHCIRKLKVKAIKSPIDSLTIRTCKLCNEEKNITLFGVVKNKNGFTNYRRICKSCLVKRKKDYMKDYHLKHYVSKKKIEEVSNAPQD